MTTAASAQSQLFDIALAQVVRQQRRTVLGESR